jgi:hypothetical protein
MTSGSGWTTPRSERTDSIPTSTSCCSGSRASCATAIIAATPAAPVTGDLATAEVARRLTLAQLTRTLGSIDLRRAAVLLRGPHEAVGQAFIELGLTPHVVE